MHNLSVLIAFKLNFKKNNTKACLHKVKKLLFQFIKYKKVRFKEGVQFFYLTILQI